MLLGIIIYIYSTYYMSQSVIWLKYFKEQANLFSRARGSENKA